MDAFVVVGVAGALLILAALLLGDVLDSIFDAVDLGGGIVSAPVIGGFLAGFGFTAAVLDGALGTTPAALLGVGAGIALGGGALLLTRSMTRMPTDPTPRAADLVGRPGVVLTGVPATGYGRVRIRSAGQGLQLNARAADGTEIPPGTGVVVVEVTSTTSVVVAPSGLPEPH